MRWALLITCLLVGCEDPPEERERRDADARDVQVTDTLTVRVGGGAITAHSFTDGVARVTVRAQSLDVRLDVEDSGCRAQPLVVTVDHLPIDVVLGRRVFLGDLSAEVEGARAAGIGSVDFRADPHDPDLTPLDGEQSFAARRDDTGLVWTLVTDRGRGGVSLTAGEEIPPLEEDVACATFGTEVAGPLGAASLVVRHRLRAARRPGGFRFALWGNDAGNRARRQRILDGITALEDPVQFVLVNGDLTADGETAQLESARAHIDETLEIPWMATLGDREVTGRAGEAYIKLIGASTFAFDVGDARIVVADSGDGTLADRVHRAIERWMRPDEPLYWAGAPIPPLRIFVSHVPPFDPFGTRGLGFKHRPEAGRLMSTLSRAGASLLVGSQVPGFSRDEVAGVTVVHSGGGGADLPDGEVHHWLLVGVGRGCSAPGVEGDREGAACAPAASRAEPGSNCGGRLFCARDLECTIGVDCALRAGDERGVCRPCVTVEARPI